MKFRGEVDNVWWYVVPEGNISFLREGLIIVFLRVREFHFLLVVQWVLGRGFYFVYYDL
ncbi:hypothetical protein GCM10023262_08380 [Bartonella pachyuromydis]|uniref:Uncharacterized protein n=1 Tax=Bartonella pachyuromydis TaxID=931097 RepID=A0ABP8VG01_9HYPH